MRRTLSLFFMMTLIISTLSCAWATGATPMPVETVTALPVIIPFENQPARPIPTRTSTPMPTISARRDFPRWVAEFSDPILRHIQTQYPVFADEFSGEKIFFKDTPKPTKLPTLAAGASTLTPTPKSKPPLYPDPQYTVFNKGWFYIVPESAKNPYYAQLENGALVLRLPTGKENKDMWVYSPHIMTKNFVLQFDIEFGEAQPGDMFRFQFEQGKTERFAFELTKSKTWAFRWGVAEDEQIRSGAYEYLAFPRARILIIAQGASCAVYLDDIPLDYVENCRADPSQKTSQKSATFHLISEPLDPALLLIDNLTLWDLDEKRP